MTLKGVPASAADTGALAAGMQRKMAAELTSAGASSVTVTATATPIATTGRRLNQNTPSPGCIVKFTIKIKGGATLTTSVLSGLAKGAAETALKDREFLKKLLKESISATILALLDLDKLIDEAIASISISVEEGDGSTPAPTPEATPSPGGAGPSPGGPGPSPGAPGPGSPGGYSSLPLALAATMACAKPPPSATSNALLGILDRLSWAHSAMLLPCRHGSPDRCCAIHIHMCRAPARPVELPLLAVLVDSCCHLLTQRRRYFGCRLVPGTSIL